MEQPPTSEPPKLKLVKPAAKKIGRPRKRRAVAKRYTPTDAQRQLVQRQKLLGDTDEFIAALLGIALSTLQRHYHKELTFSRSELLGNVAASLYKQAMNGNTQAGMFLLRTQAGWRDAASKQEITGADGQPLIPEMPPLLMVEFVEPPKPEVPAITNAN